MKYNRLLSASIVTLQRSAKLQRSFEMGFFFGIFMEYLIILTICDSLFGLKAGWTVADQTIFTS